MINVLFCSVIIVVAVWIGKKEQQFINDYQTKECDLTNRAIAQLTECREENRNYIQISDVQ